MDSYGKEFLLAFLPLFVAIDAVGTLPIILGVIQDAPSRERIRIVNIALTTALAVGFGFLFLGHALLRFLGIEVEHFAIAGGLVLLALAIRDLTGGSIMDVPDRSEMVAVVPIGTPLTAGPATLATLLLLSDRYSADVVAPAYIVNIAIAWATFAFGGVVAGFLGRGGLRAVSKIANLLLGAIAVRLIVDGVTKAFHLTS